MKHYSRYGWSDFSETFYFFTEPAGMYFLFNFQFAHTLFFPAALVEPKPSQESYFDFNNLNKNIRISTSSSLKLNSTQSSILFIMLWKITYFVPTRVL